MSRACKNWDPILLLTTLRGRGYREERAKTLFSGAQPQGMQKATLTSCNK